MTEKLREINPVVLDALRAELGGCAYRGWYGSPAVGVQWLRFSEVSDNHSLSAVYADGSEFLHYAPFVDLWFPESGRLRAIALS